MKRFLFYLILISAFWPSVSCVKNGVPEDEMSVFFDDVSRQLGYKEEDTGMRVKEVVFSPDYKTFYISTHITRDIGPYSLTDSLKTRIIVEEKVNGVPINDSSSSRLVKASNTGSDEIAQMGYSVLALIDLATPQEYVDSQKQMLAEMATVFNQSNLYVAFMEDGRVSETRLLTPYIMENYFVSTPKKEKYLFSSILEKERELLTDTSLLKANGPRSLVVFSDARVYDEENVPIDPDYFKKKTELVELADSLAGKNIEVSFVNIGNPDSFGYSDNEEVHSVFNIISEKTRGIHQDTFNYTQLQKVILGEKGENVADDRFDFINPDHKVYSGADNEITLLFYNIEDGKLITSTTAKILKGSSFRPIIVNGIPTPLLILQGCVITIIILLGVWLVFQFAYPFINYQIFLRKNVVDYTGSHMSVNNNQVGESCYLCKAPFERGDKVVVKCSHSMHKECWDENNHHCPEYGTHCHNGSHYYNANHLLDPRNAPFFLRWMLIAILAAGCSWVVYTAHLHTLSSDFFEDLILGYTQVKEGSDEALLAIKDYDDPMSQAPAFGLTLGFFLTLGLSLLSVHVTDFKRQWLEIFIRSFVAGIACCVVFAILTLIGIVLEWEVAYFVDWIPWAISPYIIVFAATWRTPVKIRKSFYWLCLVLGVVTMLLWSIQFNGTKFDYRVFQLLIFIFYSLVLSLSVAYDAPVSDHYFLRMSGGIKPIDVALYKWFKNNPDFLVTIGRSVDCALQISWDIRNDIAPVQAEIKRVGSACALIPLEHGVFVRNKEVKPESKIILYNGLKFYIGDTEFTYIEKDTHGK